MKKIILLLCILTSVAEVHALPIRFVNNRPWSIYLEIPGVMNPNLTPFSKSTAGLEPGQVVYFYHKNQRHVLFIMDYFLANQDIKIGNRIRERKKEIKKNSSSKTQ